MKIVMGKFVFDSSHVYEYAFYINDQLIIATNDDNFGFWMGASRILCKRTDVVQIEQIISREGSIPNSV